MDWSKWGPTIIALVGIPATALFAWWRERNLKDLQHDRDEAKYRESQNREDRFRREQQEREDRIRSVQQEREDQLKRDQLEREDHLMEERYKDWASQRWWDKKSEAYMQIVEALWRLLEFADASVAYYYERMDLRFDIGEKSRTAEDNKAREAADKERWKSRQDRFTKGLSERSRVMVSLGHE